MIKNLNVFTFSAYGEILQDRLPDRGFPNALAWRERLVTLRENDEFALRYESDAVYIDFEHGMVILGVRRVSGQDISYFYLDKPVRITKGTGYVLLPYGEQATVHLAQNVESHICREEVLVNARDLRIAPKLEVENVYTLFYQEKEKNFLFKGEQHSMYELTYVDKGSFHSVVEGVDCFLEQGELMIYGPEQWHMQYADAQSSVSFITITFELNFADAELLLYRKFAVGSDVVNILKKLISETEGVYYLSDDMILCYLKECILHLLRIAIGEQNTYKLETSIASANSNELIDHALRYMSEHVYDKLTVAAVAKEVNVSTSYLATLFKKELQISPSEYLSKLKLEESKRLIREGKLNFTQISGELQFATIHHFSHKFKEKYGVTPTEYAKAIR